MKRFLNTVREVAGDRIRALYLPLALSCADSILHMGMFSLFIVVIGHIVTDSFAMGHVRLYRVILLALFLLRAVLYSVNYVRTQHLGADITANLRLSLGDHIRSLNLGYFNKNSVGKLMSNLTTDIADFEQVLTHLFTNVFKVLFFSALSLLFAFVISWQVGLIALALILIAYPLLSIGGKLARRHGGKQKQSINRVISRTVEYISGIKTFKLYNLIGTQFERLDDSFTALKKDSIALELSVMPFSLLFFIVTSLMLPAALIAGSFLFPGDTPDTMRFTAVIMVAASLSSMMSTLGSLYPELVYFSKAAENIASVQKEKPLPYPDDAGELTSFGISFEHVGFHYEDGVDVLRDISFEASPGKLTALVEPSGSGKSTIISLISRFWDVRSGCVRIGGTDVREISPDDLSRSIAVVFQDVYLLNDTIANNIRIGKPSATMEEVQQAARSAQCHDFISALPDGYDTIVGEGGSTLSGGEKQRISIARALIKDAPIILLDETTSSLDADNEREINRALDTLMAGKTVVVIAHRLNTIVNADQIIVLDKGQIREKGPHKELCSMNGWYAHVIEEQERAKSWTV